jgi:HD superfamily phosphohydrolase YqeK
MIPLTVSDVIEWFPMLEEVTNKSWVDTACRIWCEVLSQSGWERPDDARFNLSTPGISLIEHTRSVTALTYNMAAELKKQYGYTFDFDKIIIIGVLHDVCKAVEFGPDGRGGAQKTDIGTSLQHAFISGYYCYRENLPLDIVSIAISHTSESNITPMTPEGILLYYADSIDADISKFNYKALALWR